MRLPGDGGHALRAVPFFVGALLALVPPARAQSQSEQGRDEEFAEVDPYTKGEAEAVDRLGYVSFGPFPLAEKLRSQDLEEALGKPPMLWVETAHFRLGSTLRTYRRIGDPREEDKLDAELKRLKKRLGKLRVPRNELDPWLRLHLYAQRLEDVYADFVRQFELVEEDFTWTRSDGVVQGGPYLGMERKFVVFLSEKQSGVERFVQHFLSRDVDTWHRDFLPGGAVMLAISPDKLREYDYRTDAALHATVASEVTLNLVEGFRISGHFAPLWLRVGLAHGAARAVDERFTLSAIGTSHGREEEWSWTWQPRVYGLVYNKAAASFEELFAWKKWDEVSPQGHLLAWSRVEWLLGREETDRHAFLLGVSGSLWHEPEAQREEMLLGRQRAALERACGLPLADVEEEWRRYVLKRYERK